jgi:hypothetical protein
VGQTAERRYILAEFFDPFNALGCDSIYKRGSASQTVIVDDIPHSKEKREDQTEGKHRVFHFDSSSVMQENRSVYDAEKACALQRRMATWPDSRRALQMNRQVGSGSVRKTPNADGRKR